MIIVVNREQIGIVGRHLARQSARQGSFASFHIILVEKREGI